MEIENDYTEEIWYQQIFRNIWHSWIKGRKLLIDIYGKPWVLGGKPSYRRSEKWTDVKRSEIHSRGYRPAFGLHDSIIWWRVKMYARIHNFEEFDMETAYPERKETAETLNDAMLSDSDEKFKKGLLKTAMTSAADWQKIGLIAVLGIGVVIGAKILGFW